MENQIALQTSGLTKDITTGLAIFGQSYHASSGFVYGNGLRDFGNLVIMEGIVKGTAVEFLSSVKVFTKDNKVVIDVPVEKGVRYSRQTVKDIVLRHLLEMLAEVNRNNVNYDAQKARIILDEQLTTAYFKESHDAMNRLAHELGIY